MLLHMPRTSGTFLAAVLTEYLRDLVGGMRCRWVFERFGFAIA